MEQAGRKNRLSSLLWGQGSINIAQKRNGNIPKIHSGYGQEDLAWVARIAVLDGRAGFLYDGEAGGQLRD